MTRASLVQAWRTYSTYHADYLCADGKLKEAEKQEEKQKQSAKKLERLIEKVNTYPKCSLPTPNVKESTGVMHLTEWNKIRRLVHRNKLL